MVDMVKQQIKKRLLLWVGAFFFSTPMLFAAIFIIFLVVIAGALNAIENGPPPSNSSGLATVVGNVNINQLLTQKASWKVYQVWPVSPAITTFSYEDHYTSTSPIPPKNELESTPVLAIDTSYQAPLVNKCYSTWAIYQINGGQPCGFAGWPGQCTFWALLNWNSPNMLKLSGNAYQFFPNAQAMGLPTSKTPVVGSIVVWGQGGGYSTDAGHVAIVVGVNNAMNTFVVSEMNFYAPWMIDYRVVSSLPGGIGYGNLEGFILPASPVTAASATPSPSAGLPG